MSCYNTTIRLTDINVDVDLELDKGQILEEFTPDELLEAVRESWSDHEILDELDHAKVEAWADSLNEPVWVDGFMYLLYSDEEKKALGIPRRLKF